MVKRRLDISVFSQALSGKKKMKYTASVSFMQMPDDVKLTGESLHELAANRKTPLFLLGHQEQQEFYEVAGFR